MGVAPSETIRQLGGRVPEEIVSEDDTITVVFAGQYSAGKSTILKAITGRQDIAIGAEITTQKAHTYDWDGVRIVDTPGVHTELRPDHDEITYRSISEADLLVFVLTNELFDSHLAAHFRKLAIDRGKSHEMMLVVNKMRRCAKGNSAEMQEIISNDLKKVLTPFSPEDLRTTFVDAEAVLESKEESDVEVSAVLYRKSGFEKFSTELNQFVRDRGLSGRYTTALYNLEQVLQEALAAESTGDKDVDALEELLLQRRRALLETQDRLPRAVDNEIQRTVSSIRQDGRKVADLIHASASQEEVDRELQAAQNRVQEYSEQLNATVEKVIGKHIEGLDQRMSSIAESELAKELLERLAVRIKQVDVSPEAMAKLSKTADVSQKLGKFLIDKSFSLKSGFRGLFNLNHYSGTATHGAVKSIAKFFGYKFRPWEAVKWTKGIANAGRALAVVGTILTFVLQFKEDMDAEQLEVDLRESRASIRAGFNEAAHQIEMHFDKATGAYVDKTFTVEIENVDRELDELREMQQSRSDLFDSLVGLLNETREMIKQLHVSG